MEAAELGSRGSRQHFWLAFDSSSQILVYAALAEVRFQVEIGGMSTSRTVMRSDWKRVLRKVRGSAASAGDDAECLADSSRSERICVALSLEPFTMTLLFTEKLRNAMATGQNLDEAIAEAAAPMGKVIEQLTKRRPFLPSHSHDRPARS